MAQASLTEFKLMLRNAGGISNDALQLALDDAKSAVLKDGVAESHGDFSQLQRYKAAHLLVSWGQVNQAAVASESVGDVSRTFTTTSTSSPSGASDSYQEKYRSLLNGIIGFKHKVA